MGKTGVDRPQQAGTSLVAGFSSTLHNRSLLVPTHKLQNAHTNYVDATNASQYKRLYKYVLFQLGGVISEIFVGATNAEKNVKIIMGFKGGSDG